METGNIIVIYGMGKGKTNSAIGKGIQYLGEGKTVSMIQFLKGKRGEIVFEVLKKLEPEMKIFRFEKHEEKFADLDPARKEEELNNIRNGLSFARKVLSTQSCDVLILDEVLGLVDRHIITEDELVAIIQQKPEDMDLIITGRVLTDNVRGLADQIFRIEAE